MAGIWNVTGGLNININKVRGKLSFDINQIFLAKISQIDKETGEIILKLLDGWKFPAKILNSNDNEHLPKDTLMKFQVDSFEDGVIQLKILPNNNKEPEVVDEDSLQRIIRNDGLNLEKNDIKLLDSMVKHDIPLNKENISEIKNIIKAKDEIAPFEDKCEEFITKLLDSKGIQIQSQKGIENRNILKGFFNQLKDMDVESILSMIENNIDITEDNMKSFNKLISSDFSISKNIESLLKEVAGNNNAIIKGTILEKNIEDINGDNNKNQINGKEEIINLIEKHGKVQHLGNEKIQIENKANNEVFNNKLENLSKQENSSLDKNKNLKQQQGIINRGIIKDQITEKIEQTKKMIETLINKNLDDDSGKSSESYNKVLSVIGDKINDFRVFNSLSNQYYYLHIPINFNKDDYNCKLLIKDDRKSGKKVDSKNVKMMASVKTINMGTVDAFITIKNKNMNLELTCEKSWTYVFEQGKDKIRDILEGMGYIPRIDVSKKQKEANVVTCRNFFNDVTIGNIDTKV